VYCTVLTNTVSKKSEIKYCFHVLVTYIQVLASKLSTNAKFQNLQIFFKDFSRIFKYFQAPYLFSSTFTGLEVFIPNSSIFKDFKSTLWTLTRGSLPWVTRLLTIHSPTQDHTTNDNMIGSRLFPVDTVLIPGIFLGVVGDFHTKKVQFSSCKQLPNCVFWIFFPVGTINDKHIMETVFQWTINTGSYWSWNNQKSANLCLKSTKIRLMALHKPTGGAYVLPPQNP